MQKKKMKKILSMLALGAFSISMVVGCGSNDKPANTEQSGDSEKYNIGIVQLVTHGSLDAANQGFVQGLADNGFVDGENIVISQQNAQGEQSNLQSIAQQFLSTEVDLICAIATPAAQVMASATEEIPIVGTAITDYVSANLVNSNEKPGLNVTGTSDMNPVGEQLDLLLQLVPDAKTIGVLYTSSEVNSQVQVAALKARAAELEINVVEATISNVNDIQQAAQSLVGKVDAIYLPTDNNISSAITQVVAMTEEAGLVTVCGEAAQVNAGGTATYGIDYYKLGYQTGVMAAKILKGEAAPAEMPIQFMEAEDLSVTLNNDSLTALGVTVPAELAETAEIVKTAE